jgi:hypothetical protein
VGLFKSETRDTFLKVEQRGDSFALACEEGVSTGKLDKGCLVFNTEREAGYVAAVVDGAGRAAAEPQGWAEGFLRLCPRRDEYFNTQQVMALCRDFVHEELPQQLGYSKADQAALLSKSVQFFREKDSFNLGEFNSEVMAQPEVIESFARYKADYQQAHEVELADDFAISGDAVRRQARSLKSVIKLDKNFHIYVHGDRQLIEQGTDEQGRKFYRLFYQEEK